MDLVANLLLAIGAFGAGAYCFVLAGKIKKFSTLESGMGTAIAVLSAQVDDMTRALEKARGTASASTANLESVTARGEAVAARLELLLASMHDLPESRDDALPRHARPRFTRRRVARETEVAE
jgi:hypothetical protein